MSLRVLISKNMIRQHLGTDKIKPEADVVESLVVNAECLVCVLHQLVDGERGVVGLHHGVGDLHKAISQVVT